RADVGIEIDAERLQDVGGARFRREIAVAVLGDRHAGASDDDRGRCRDVEGAGTVAARADGVDRAGRGTDRQRFGAHGARRAGDLFDGLAAQPQRHQERAHLRWRRVTGHHYVESGGAVVFAQALAGGEANKDGFEINFGHAAIAACAASSRKFLSSECPATEAMLSGWNCTPCSGRSRWAMPMTRPSSVQALTRRLSGRLARSTISEW